MPATTRSSNKQAHIDNPNETKAAVTGSKRKKETTEAPRKSHKSDSQHPRKGSPKGDGDKDQAEDGILINRAPVLELWAASVTSFIHPLLPWPTCVSAGSAISTLCAVSKGRAIGAIEKPDQATAESKREDRKKHAQKENLEELEVMSFHLKLKDGQALVGDKPKKGEEAALVKKFGQSEYARTKDAFEKALESWRESEKELNAHAFHFYEDFRPTVPKGQKGWGRKGMLNLQAVKDAVQRQ